MSTAKAKRAEVAEALKQLQPHGIRHVEFGSNVDPPGTVIGPPRLTWEAYVPDPTAAQFLVYLVVQLDDRAVDKMLDLLPLVTDAIESVPDAVVTTATPTVYTVGNSDLPAYEITAEVSL